MLEAQELGQAYNLLSLDTEARRRRRQEVADAGRYVGQTDAGLELLEDRANLERAFEVPQRPRARDPLLALLRERLADRDRQAPQRLPNARLAPPAKGARKTAHLPRRVIPTPLSCPEPVEDATRLRRLPLARRSSADLSTSPSSAMRGGALGKRIDRFCRLRIMWCDEEPGTPSSFVDYFVARRHTHLASASLIPDAMRTTLFTIAGMEQFVPVFLGEEPPPAPRAVTVQRCLRVAGAKSDIENVGRTGRHGTFLEMLGNFSFGDYYKREAIGFAWELATNVWKLDKDKLYVTVHTTDDEAQTIWEREIGLASSRISRWDEDNFWTMGATGPCGPCTEMFYDNGPAYACRSGRRRTEQGQPFRRDSGTSSSSSTIAAPTACSAICRAKRSIPAWASSACSRSSTARPRCTRPTCSPTDRRAAADRHDVALAATSSSRAGTSSPITRAR